MQKWRIEHQRWESGKVVAFEVHHETEKSVFEVTGQNREFYRRYARSEVYDTAADAYDAFIAKRQQAVVAARNELVRISRLLELAEEQRRAAGV